MCLSPPTRNDREPSPELARISPLVTRPPKPSKPSNPSKNNNTQITNFQYQSYNNYKGNDNFHDIYDNNINKSINDNTINNDDANDNDDDDNNSGSNNSEFYERTNISYNNKYKSSNDNSLSIVQSIDPTPSLYHDHHDQQHSIYEMSRPMTPRASVPSPTLHTQPIISQDQYHQQQQQQQPTMPSTISIPQVQNQNNITMAASSTRASSYIVSKVICFEGHYHFKFFFWKWKKFLF